MRKKFFLLALVSFFLFLCPTPSHAQLTTWDVRNTTGDYDEQVLYGYASCYEYPMQYTGTWRGYVECPGSGCYAGFAVNTLQNLGKICYRSRVDANSNLRGGFGFYGSGVQEYARLCRRNYQVAFENQPSSPVGFEFYYTKEEIDYLISSFNATYGTSK